MTNIDQFVQDYKHILSKAAVRELAIMNALSHEVRADGVSFSNHPKDPGGATNYGISLRFLRKQESGVDSDGFAYGDYDRDGDIDADDIRALTVDQAGELYVTHFWKPHKIDKLPARLAIKIFDMAVNMGPRRAIRLLQKALNRAGFRVAVDGVIGPETLGVLNPGPTDQDADRVLDVLAATRDVTSAFYEHLAEARPELKVFLKGWLKRALS